MRNLAIVFVLLLAAGSVQAGDGGTVRITNRDGSPRYIEIDPQERIVYIYPDSTGDSAEVAIPAGGVATTELAPGTWSVYGNDDPRFTIMIARDGDYDLTLQPFSQTNAYGVASYGLLGVIDDGYNHSSYQLFPLAQVPQQTIVVQPPPPATPPVVVVPGPTYYYPPTYYRRDKGRELGEAIGSAVFDILGEVLSDDHDHHHRRRHR